MLSIETRADWNIKKTMYKYAYVIKCIDRHLCHSGKSIFYLSKERKKNATAISLLERLANMHAYYGYTLLKKHPFEGALKAELTMSRLKI